MDSRRNNAEKIVESIIYRHEGPLLSFAEHLTGDSELAQDIVEGAFLNVLRSRKQSRDLSDGALAVHLFRAVSEGAGKRISRKRPGKRAAVKDRQERVETGGAVLETVRNLDFAAAQVVILRVCEGLAISEISLITGLDEDCIDEILAKSIIRTATELKKAGLL